MTEQSEVEKVAKELAKVAYRTDEWSDLVDGLKDGYMNLARWHIREKEIAVLEARIDELQRTGDFSEYRGRYEELQSRLAELRKEPNTINDKEKA